MTQITRVQSNTVIQTYNASLTTTSATITLNEAALPGNFLIASIAQDKAVTTFNTPSGWTALKSTSGASVSQAVFYKIAAGGESSLTVTWTTGGAGGAMTIAEYSGVDTTTPIGVSHAPAYSDTAVTSLALGGITPTRDGLALAFFGIDSTTNTSNFNVAATGWTRYGLAIDTLGQACAAVLQKDVRSPISTAIASTTFSWVQSDQVQGYMVVLNDAVPVTVDFDGGTNGATIAAGGPIETATTSTYTTGGAIHGSSAMTSTATNSLVRVVKPSGFASSNAHTASVYVRPTNVIGSGGSLRVFALQNSANGVLCYVRISTAGKLETTNGTTLANTGTYTMSNNVVYRIDYTWDGDTGKTVTAKLYLGDSPTLLDSISTTQTAASVWNKTFVSGSNSGTAGITADIDTFRLYDGVVTPAPYAPAANALVSTITEDWASGSISGTKWNSYMTPTVVSQRLRVDTVTTYEDVTSVDRFVLTGSSAFVEIPTAPLNTTGNETYFSLLTAGDDKVEWMIVGNSGGTQTILARRKIGGINTTVGSTGYVPATHKFFRIRESGGTIFWDTSVDASTWTNRYSWVVSNFTMTALKVALGSGNWNGVNGDSYAEFDNLNLVPSGVTRTGKVNVWDGTAWVSRSVKTWSGSAWVVHPVKVWNGSAWVIAK